MFKRHDVIGLGTHAIEQIVRLKVFNEAAHTWLCPPWNYELIEGGFLGNVLIALTRLGLKTGYLGKVGGDQFGIRLMKSRVNEAIDFSHCEISPTSDSARVWLILSENGEQCRILFPNILSHVDEKYIMRNKSYIRSCRLLLIDVSMVPLNTCILAAELAKAEQIPVIVCLNIPESELLGTLKSGALKELEELISFSDLFAASPGALEELAPQSDPIEQAEHLQKKYLIPHVLLLEERKGCILATESDVSQNPAFEVEALDPFGYRDAFLAGMCFGFFHNWPLPQLARFANACAALNSLSIGIHTGMKSEEEVLQFLSKHG